MMAQEVVSSNVFWASNGAVRLSADEVRVYSGGGGGKGHRRKNDSSTDDDDDVVHQPPRRLRVATWNLLAPPYATNNDLEKHEWRSRLASQQRQLEDVLPDVAALQEFWTASDEAVALWRRWAEDRDYALVVLPRTRGKADGCATLVRNDLLFRQSDGDDDADADAVESGCEPYGLGYDDWGDRVCLCVPVVGLLVCNTHFTFAHDNAWDPVMRRHQARKLAEHLAGRRCLLLGDLNGEKHDPALRILQDHGFALHEPRADDDDIPDWKSHYAHTHEFLACDFVATKGIPPAVVNDVTLHGDHGDLVPKKPPRFRVSDHLMLSATLDLRTQTT
eukprot:CAMPEP_0118901008 /NCGR_PEP_ID=MMETSP1166-20130328/6885_1 /TAXON_ID=1104430 /ORGANISM="Chrysoreinhardia sp, Strain CCMP3193" /LENGTH=332 /DNA_ID=CAMNT_0006840165 /DNA_START=114 /DNA_END=1112 /DNA_ORIENTATION=+